jgi:glycosidase
MQSLIDGTEAWTTVVMENHDQARSISRFGSDKTPEVRNRSGKMLAMLLATLSGTLYIYQEQEIGAVNAPESWSMDEYKDIESYAFVREKTNGDAAALSRAKVAIQHLHETMRGCRCCGIPRSTRVSAALHSVNACP